MWKTTMVATFFSLQDVTIPHRQKNSTTFAVTLFEEHAVVLRMFPKPHLLVSFWLMDFGHVDLKDLFSSLNSLLCSSVGFSPEESSCFAHASHAASHAARGFDALNSVKLVGSHWQLGKRSG